MKYLHNKFKVLLIVLTIIVLIVSSSFVSAQTTKVTDKFGNELRVESNPVTNSVKRMYRVNAPVSRFGVSTGQIGQSNIEQLGKSIIKDYEDILGISSDDLKAYRTRQGRNSTWHLGFRQLYKNVPVWASFIRYTIEGNGIVKTISADIHPGIKLSVDPNISADNAVSTAINAFKEDVSDTIVVIEKPSLYIYPKIVKDSVSYSLTYKVGLRKESPFKKYIYFINAENGEVVHNESLLVDSQSNNNGNVQVAYYPEHSYDNTVAFSDLSSVTVQIKNTLGQTVASGSTNSSGDYNIDWNKAYAAYYLWGHHNLDLVNSYCRILDDDPELGTHAYGYFTPGSTIEHDWSWATDETNVYYHVNLIHDYITDGPFYYDDMDYQCDAHVRWDQDNAQSDGTDLWFGDATAYAKSSDVIYHEYTHSIIHHLYEGNWIGTGTYTQSGALNEGLPDYFAATLNDDSRLGESVGLGTWRDFDEPRTMSQYIFSGGDNVQYRNGHIAAGAIWDMRQTGSIGEELADELLFFALVRNPDDFAELLDDILTEDDTDADLSNGTPHIDAILYAFENHEIYTSHADVPPAAPKNLDVSGGWLENPTLSWTANTEPDLDEYVIYRSPPEKPWYVQVGTTSNTSWVDNDVVLGPHLGLWKWYVKAKDDDGNTSNASNIASAWGVDKMIGEGREIGGIPTAYSLNQNYPNPFNPETKIQFGLPEDSNVKLEIFNLQGQIVATLVDGALSAGYHTATFDATTYPSGVYFYKIVAGNFTDIKRMLLIK